MTLIEKLKGAVQSEHGIYFVENSATSRFLLYKEIYENALILLGSLQKRGVRKGNEVILLFRQDKEFICAFWACLLGGLLPIPFSHDKLSLARISVIWPTLDNPILLLGDEMKHYSHTHGEINHVELKILQKSIFYGELSKGYKKGIITDVSENSLAFIQYSSGSTGSPKGVKLTHKNLLSNIYAISKNLAITKKDRILNWMPLTHDMGMIGFHLLGVVMSIPAVQIQTQLFVKNPMLWMTKAAEFKSTILYTSNFGIQFFLSSIRNYNRELDWDLSHIRVIVNGAEFISYNLAKDFVSCLQKYHLHPNTIVPAYGLAEASVAVCTSSVNHEIEHIKVDRGSINIGGKVRKNSNLESSVEFVCVGVPVPGCEIRITDQNDKELPERTIGLIEIRGTNVTSGYYNNSEATGKLFSKNGWLKTGDLGFLREGRLTVVGRIKDLIIINGQNYFTKDLEHILIQEQLAERGKLSISSYFNERVFEEQLIIFIVDKKPDDKFCSRRSSIRKCLLDKFSIYAESIIAVQKIPKTTSGKIQSFILLKQYEEGKFADQVDDFHDHIIAERRKNILDKYQLIEIVRNILGNNTIDVDTNLFSCGLDSLNIVRILEKIRTISGLDIHISDLYKYKSLNAIYDSCVIKASNLHSGIVQSGTSGEFSMSLSQQRIWKEVHMLERSIAYNIPLVFHVNGYLELERLSSALFKVVSKFDILRASFHYDEGQYFQKIHDMPIRDSLIEREIFTDSNSHLIESRISEEANKPFNLSVPGAFRVYVFFLSESRSVLLFVFHHIIVDGWSIRVLLKEIAQEYSFRSSEISFSSQEALSYNYFIQYQTNRLNTADMLAKRFYWQQEFQNEYSPTSFSVRPYLPNATGLIRTEKFNYIFNKEWKASLTKVASSTNSTSFIVIMALINILLYRYNDTEEIIMAFDVNGRSNEKMESIVGYLLNTICLKVNLNRHESFLANLNRVKSKIIAALDNQEYPFENLLEDLLSSQPNLKPFDVLVVFNNRNESEYVFKLEGCDISCKPVKVDRGLVDIFLEFNDYGEYLELCIQYNNGRYNQLEVQRFSKHLELILLEGAECPDRCISDFRLVTPEERGLFVSNRKSSSKAHFISLIDLINMSATTFSNNIAIKDGDKSFTYFELIKVSISLSAILKNKLKVVKNDKVGIAMGRSFNYIVSIMSVLRCGAAFIPIDLEYLTSKDPSFISRGGCRLIITDSNSFQRINLSDNIPIFILEDLFDSEYDDQMNDYISIGESDLAYIIYSSGTIDRPKGILIEHGSISNYIQQFVKSYRLSSSDSVIFQSPIGFDTSIEEIFSALCSGSTLVIARNGAMDIGALSDLIQVEHATVLSATPLVLNELNQMPKDKLSTLRLVISGGDVLQKRHIDSLISSTEVFNTYGPSETTICCSYKNINPQDDSCNIGKAIDGYSIYILGQNLERMPVMKVGEIMVAGCIARGYVDNFGSDRFIYFQSEEERLFCTGDFGYFDENGDVAYLYRKDDMVKILGVRVSVSEVEDALSSCDLIQHAIVLAVKSEGGTTLNSFLILKDLSREDETIIELRKHLRNCLPRFMIPSTFTFLSDFPKTKNGKIDKTKLLNDLVGTKRFDSEIHLLSRIERTVIRLCDEVLNSCSTKLTDDFFDIGGHSLNANQLINRLKDHLGIRIELADLFANSIIKSLALLLRQREEEQYDIVELI